MPVNKYPAFAFRQRSDAPLQVAFVASSQQIDNWARVPTKNTGNVRNFQRAEIAGHVKEIEGFFENEANCSPTAVVVGFDPFRSRDRITIEKDGEPLSFGDVTSGDPTPCELVIDWPELKQSEDRETKPKKETTLIMPVGPRNNS